MPITFTNRLTSRPLVVPLNSGATLRLSPGQTSQEFPEREAEHNPKIDKLRQQGHIEVRTVTGPSRRPKAASEGRSGQADRKTPGSGRKPGRAGGGGRKASSGRGASSGSRPGARSAPGSGAESPPDSGSTAG